MSEANKAIRKFFGTDGIRGVANKEPLNPEFLVLLGKAIASVFLGTAGKHKIIIGKDTRLSGYMIEMALASGMTSMGAEVMLSGPIPTPGIAYLTRSMRCDAGVMISASHNTYEDNGIKIFGSDGYKLADEVELKIEELISSGNIPNHPDASRIGKAYRIDDALGRYTVYLKNCFPPKLSLAGVRIGLDSANGASYVLAPQTLEELGAELVVRGNAPNGKNINAGFGSLFPEVVSSLVKEYALNIGLALDGDADRVIFSDEKGEIVDGDMVLAICAVYLKEKGQLKSNKVVATVMTNLATELYLKANGIELVRTAVGDRYVLEQMLKQNIELGGEQSGHMIFAEDSTTGDGVLTALKMLEIMQSKNKKLSELANCYTAYPQKLINLKVREKRDFAEIPEIVSAVKAVEKTLGSKGRVLLRYSGTENKARVMVECEDEKICNQCAHDIADAVSNNLGN